MAMTRIQSDGLSLTSNVTVSANLTVTGTVTTAGTFFANGQPTAPPADPIGTAIAMSIALG